MTVVISAVQSKSNNYWVCRRATVIFQFPAPHFVKETESLLLPPDLSEWFELFNSHLKLSTSWKRKHTILHGRVSPSNTFKNYRQSKVLMSGPPNRGAWDQIGGQCLSWHWQVSSLHYIQYQWVEFLCGGWEHTALYKPSFALASITAQ